MGDEDTGEGEAVGDGNEQEGEQERGAGHLLSKQKCQAPFCTTCCAVVAVVVVVASGKALFSWEHGNSTKGAGKTETSKTTQCSTPTVRLKPEVGQGGDDKGTDSFENHYRGRLQRCRRL